MKWIFLFLALFIFTTTNAQPAINTDLLTKPWHAKWITAENGSPFDYGVYHFRKSFNLAAKPASFIIHVTGDNRYQLFVNGTRVVWGPARGDLNHWRYETVDIAKYLKAGKNVLAAVVWNGGEYAPDAQITWRTGFLLQGNTKAEEIVNTDKTWKAIRNEAYAPLYFSHAQMKGYFVAGPAEKIAGDKYPWGWETENYDDAKWTAAAMATKDGRNGAAPRDSSDGGNLWMLVPRNIPLMEETPERIAVVRKAEGVSVPASFPAQATAWQIPANTKATILLDQSYLTTAYPELIVSGGKGSVLQLSYAESLFVGKNDPNAWNNNKGNRNEIEGKYFRGYYDIFTTDGGQQRMFRPLWWRTYRYLELKIETNNEPLTIEDLRGVYTGFPFQAKAKFDAGDDVLAKILSVGWRTARLDAHETYMDCPYYEQLQYVGDTRIQGLISLYYAGDARLMKNAIALINDSRTSEGATMSRFPTRQQQYIPPFSLWWIGMVHDYWRYQNDPKFVQQMLPGVRAVLSFFASKQQDNGSLGKMPWWNYVDWTKEWEGGVPPRDANGSSAPQDLQLLLAYDWAADLDDALGSKAQAAEARAKAVQLRATIQKLYWDANKKMFADTPEKKHFSQHANVLAILADLIKGQEARDLFNRIEADKSLVQCSYYFKHYLHSAANKVGEGDRYIDFLADWKGMLARGLTTFAEQSDPTRSDCHAWSASPNFELFRTVLGIDSASAGFQKIVIRPFLGKLKQVNGAIPHPNGEISVNLAAQGNRINAEVNLPSGTSGEFIWQGKTKSLAAGKNKIAF